MAVMGSSFSLAASTPKPAPFAAMGRAKPAPFAAMGRAIPKVAPIVTAASKASTAFAPSVDVSRFGRGGGFGAGFGTSSSAAPASPTAPQINNASEPASVPLPGLDGGGAGAAAAPRSSGERATSAGGERDADVSEFGVKLPTWMLVAGVVVFAGLGAFALHRTLPHRK